MDDAFERCPEFVCCECGRHVVQIAGPVSDPPMCCACQVVPGWLDVAEVRAIIDPGGDANPPDLGAVPAWTGGARGGL